MFSLNIANIFDRAVDIHKKYLKSIVLYQFIMTILISAIAFVGVFLILIVTAFGSIGFAASGRLPAAAIIFIGILIVLLATFLFAVSSLGTVGMMDVVRGDFTGKKIDMSEMFSFTFKHFFKVLGVSFAMILVLLPLVAVWIGLGWMFFYNLFNGVNAYSIGENISNQPFIIIAALIIYILLVLFSAIIYKTLYAFTIHAVVFQNKNFFKALSESRRLVRKNFWRIMGYIILFYFVVWAIYSAINSFFLLIASVVMYFLNFFNANSDLLTNIQVLSQIVTWPMRILEQLFITPLSGLFVTLLYCKQRFKKDGYDIVLKLENMKNSMKGQIPE